MITTLDAESIEAVAQSFLQVADNLALANMRMIELIRMGSSLKEEKEAIDAMGLNAPETIRALRCLAMRLDRGALGKFEAA